MTKLLVQANRNGFYYVLDRTTGEFLAARRFVEKMNWASGLDAKGRPIELPHMDPTPAVSVCARRCAEPATGCRHLTIRIPGCCT